MKAIISSTYLREQLKEVLHTNSEMVVMVTNQIVFVGAETIDIQCEVLETGSAHYERKGWEKLYDFLAKISEQPVVLETGHGKVVLSQFIMDFY